MEQKIKRRFVSPLMLSLALFAFESTVAQTNNSVAGFVYGSGRVPLADLPVELQNEFNQLISRTKTDGSGRYTFLRSPQGRRRMAGMRRCLGH